MLNAKRLAEGVELESNILRLILAAMRSGSPALSVRRESLFVGSNANVNANGCQTATRIRMQNCD
jgi:hypothetical protein